MKIRKMKIEDYDALYSLWLSCNGMRLNNIDDSKEGVRKFIERNPTTCFVAIKDNTIIGNIMTGNDGRRGYIYHTAVHKKFRNQKIAKQLVTKALKELSLLGITKVALCIFKTNETGNIFWEKLGFSQRNDLIYRDKELTDIIKINT